MPPKVTVADLENQKKKQQALENEPSRQLVAIEQAIYKSIAQLATYLDGTTSKTEVVNQLKEVGTPDALKVVEAVNSLHSTLKSHKNADLTGLVAVIKQALKESRQIDNLKAVDYTDNFKNLGEAVKSVERVIKEQKLVAKAPIINVPEAKVSVAAPNLLPLQSAIRDVVTAVKSIVIPDYKPNNAEVEKQLKKSNKLLADLLKKPMGGFSGGGGRATPYEDASGNPLFVTLTAGGKVPVDATVNATVDTTGLATDTNQTNGSQKTQIVDAGGEVATVTGGKLDVNATASLAGDAIPATGATTAVSVQVVDGSGNQITSFGGGTQYTEDAAAAANPVGNMLIGRRKDTLSVTEVSADGDNIALNSTNKGQLHVKLADTVTVDGSGVTQPVSGTFWQATQPVSATSLPLPSGAATAAKQPAPGTAGTASADVLSVQGVASMTALKVDGSGVTQPVSGTVTANAGTGTMAVSNTNLDVALSTRLKPADTLTKVATVDTITNVVHVDDNSGSLTVDGTVGVSGTVTVDSELTTADLDTGAGTDTRAVVGLVGSKSGGGVLIPGDATKGLAVDLTNTGANSTAIKVDNSAVTQPVSGTVTANAGSGTMAVSLASVPSHAVTNAGTFAVQATEADGANTTLGAKADAKSTATDTTAVSAMSVLKQISASVQAPPSQAVTNAGTFAVQATLAAETTKIIGAVNNLPATVDTNSGTKSASTLRVVLATDQPALTNKLLVTPDANSAVNVAQINGVTTLMGNGVTGTGSQRVTIASDNTAFAVNPNASSGAVGTTIYKNTALAATKQAVNASAGNLYGYHIYNPNTAVMYVQFYNVASASVTVGTTAADMILAVPGLGWADSPASGPPIGFQTAMTVAATTTATGSGAPGTGLLVNLFYK